MSEPMKIVTEKDGIPVVLEEAEFVKHHYHSGEWTQGGRWAVSLHETRYSGLLILSNAKADERAEFILTRLLGAIVNHYLKQGWVLYQMTTESAILVRP